MTVQAIETTPNEAPRLVQTTFQVPIIINKTAPLVTFNESTIANTTRPNTNIGAFTVHNLDNPYRLELIDNYHDGLRLEPTNNVLVLMKPLADLPLTSNGTQLVVPVKLVDSKNNTILTTTFPLSVLYPTKIDPCSNKDCGNGQCISLNGR